MKTPSLTFISTLILLTAACGIRVGNPDDDDDQEPTPKNHGAIVVNLTDAPIDEAKNVLVNITGLAVAADDDEWIEIPLVDMDAVDLLTLQNGKQMLIGELGDLPAGDYSQVRLYLDEENPGSVLWWDDTDVDLQIPSGSQSGLKIVSPFTVIAGETLAVTIDFDVRKSLVLKGGDDESPLLKPTLRLIVDADAASIQIDVDAEDGAVICAYAEDEGIDEDNSCPHAITSTLVKEGTAELTFLPVGAYRIGLYSEGQPPVDLGVREAGPSP